MALSSKHLRAQQIKNFIGGYKLEHPMGAEEDKFMRNVNGGIISSLDGEILLKFILICTLNKYTILLIINV